MSGAQRLAMTVVTILLLLVIARLSVWSLEREGDDAAVRLSWRAAPLRVEECRPLSDEEQAGVPAHMRRSEECTGYHVDYELRLEVDGRVSLVDTVAPSGLRRDRPVYVLRDEQVPPGEYTVRVSFTALVPDGHESTTLPLALEWTGPMTLAAGDVGLITLDETGREMVRVGPDRGP